MEFQIPAMGAHTWNLGLPAPPMRGDTELTATAETAGIEPTRSRRLIRIE